MGAVFARPVQIRQFQASDERVSRGAYHRLGILYLDYAHPLDLLWGEETKLDLLDRLQRSAGIWEAKVRHDCSGCRKKLRDGGFEGGCRSEGRRWDVRVQRERKVTRDQTVAKNTLYTRKCPAQQYTHQRHSNLESGK